MDLQQTIALSIVAAAAFLLVLRTIRRRGRAKFKECADCHCAETPVIGPGPGSRGRK